MNRTFTMLLLTMTSCTVETVGPTERGLVLDDKDDPKEYKKVLLPGTHIIPLYDDLINVDILEREYSEEFDCLTKDNKYIKVNATLRYYPIPDQVVELYKLYGNNYVNFFIIPEFKAAIRKSIIHQDSINIDIENVNQKSLHTLDSIYNIQHVAVNYFKLDISN